MEYLRQWRQRRSNIRKSLRWLNHQPATHVISFIELAAVFGKWLARVHGAGLVASMALLIAAYTSLTGASDHICAAVNFVSETIRGAQGIAEFFIYGGALALPAASMPNIIRFSRNVIGDKKYSANKVDAGKEIDGLLQGRAYLILFIQSLLISFSFIILVICISGILSPRFFKSADLLEAWAKFEEPCPHPPLPLRMLPIPSIDLRDWPTP
jgi:hypothetical protein